MQTTRSPALEIGDVGAKEASFRWWDSWERERDWLKERPQPPKIQAQDNVVFLEWDSDE